MSENHKKEVEVNLFGENLIKKEKENIKIYSAKEVKEACNKYFKGNDKLANVWADKYAIKNNSDDFLELDPNEMHHRIAKELARIELKYENPMTESEIFDLLKDFRYIVPQGGPMAGIGNNTQIMSLSNCFVVGNEKFSDSYGGIFKIDQEQVQLMKRRGGVGHDLSQLRPKNSIVKNSALTSTGMASFMERFSNSTKEVAQGGRRGALMLSVSVKHPDVLDFIRAKTKTNKIDSANVSIRLTDDFMQAVVDDTEFTQQFPVDSPKPKIVKKVKAKEIFDEIIEAVWSCGDPGVLFWDTIIKESLPDCYADVGYKTISTNPCGEIPLCAYDSCRLLTVNLFSYVVNPFTKEAYFDYDLFKKHSHYAQRLMDDIVDLEIEKIEAILDKIKSDPEDNEIKRIERKLWENIQKKAAEGRRSGLGHIGLADALAALGISYNSEKAIETVSEIQKTYSIEVYKSSVNLAKERGAFPIYDKEKEINNIFLNRLKEADTELAIEMDKYGRRNIALLTLAPTGTTSMIANVSSGVEPVFSIAYARKISVQEDAIDKKNTYFEDGKYWKSYAEFHPNFEKWAKINGHSLESFKQNIKINKKTSNSVIDQISFENNPELKEIIEISPYHKSTAYELNYLFRIKLQAAIQKWIDHSISSTINFSEETSETIISDAYRAAWELGCKGLTIYRENCKNHPKKSTDKTRPDVLPATVSTFSNKDKKWIAFIGLNNGKPYEIFTGPYEDVYMLDFENIISRDDLDKKYYIRKEPSKNLDKKSEYRFTYELVDKKTGENRATGSFLISTLFSKEYWNYAILISCLMRYDAPLESVIKTVGKLQYDNNSIAELNTWKTGVKRALKLFLQDNEKAALYINVEKCEVCGSVNLIHQLSCVSCKDCTWSKCSGD